MIRLQKVEVKDVESNLKKKKIVIFITGVVVLLFAVITSFWGYQKFNLSKKHIEGFPEPDSVYEVNVYSGPYGVSISDPSSIKRIVEALKTAKATDKKASTNINFAETLDVVGRFHDENGEYDAFSFYIFREKNNYYIDINFEPNYPMYDDYLWQVDDEFYNMIVTIVSENEVK
jgi:hypothetical protein